MGFDDLLGNRRIRNILSSYLKNDVIPYSMIFSGPGSASMLKFAIAFARGVNCLGMQGEGDFCGQCVNCLEIEKEVFMDLNILVPDGQFYKKEQILYLVEDNYRKPIKGNRKINILTDAHKMNANSANAFLKVLEEPAPLNTFILLTDNLRVMLPTITSRCQILRFSPLSRTEIKTYLTEKGMEGEKAKQIAYLGSNMEKALDTDYDAFMKKRQEIFNILQSLLSRQGMETILMDLFKRSRSREKFVAYFTDLVNHLAMMLRDIMVLQIEDSSQFLINIDYKERFMPLCRYLSIEKALLMIRKMEYLLRDTQRNLNTKVLILEFMNSYTIDEVNDV